MKQVRHARLALCFGLAGAFALAIALGPESGTQVGAQAAPPPPPLPGPTAAPSAIATALPSGASVPTVEPTPAASQSPSGRRGRRRRGANPESSASPSATSATSAPEPTATPTSPAFATLDGTWEVQLQYIDHTDYAYLDIAQNSGGTLIGTWRAPGGKQYPFEGTYDGRLIRMTAKEDATSIVFTGYVEGAQDMVGLVDFGAGAKDQTPFTASHRGGVSVPKAPKAPKKHKGASPTPKPST